MVKHINRIGGEEYHRRRQQSLQMKNNAKQIKKQQEDKFVKIIDEYWKEIIEFPMGQICKHLAVIKLFQILENSGYKLNEKLVHHIVFAEDEEALKYESFKIKEKK